MSKRIEKIYNSLDLIFLLVIIIVWFIFEFIDYGSNIFEVFKQQKNIMRAVLTISIQVITAGIGTNKGIEIGINSEEFEKADKKNSEIVSYVNENFERVLDFIEYKNDLELTVVRKEFLRSIEKRSVDELTPKQLRKYNKLKHWKWTAKGLALPLYYEHSKGKTHSFNISFNAKAHKVRSMTQKLINGVLLSFLGLDIMINSKNLNSALTSTMLLVGGMVITFSFGFIKPYNKLKIRIVKETDNKYRFYEEFKKYINKSTL